MDWYRRSFGTEYLRLYSNRGDEQARRETAFLLGVLKPPLEARILDLACGAGRHSRALRARGFLNVVGVDLSWELLKAAAARAEGQDSPTLLARGDMRRIPFRGCFDIALSMFTSFGYFEDDSQDALVVRGVARALKPGGRVVLDLPNRPQVAAGLVPESITRRNGETFIERRRLRERGGLRVEKKITIMGAGREERRVDLSESVRLYSLDEIRRLLAAAAIETERCFGGFDGSEIDDSSVRMLVLGRKKDEN